MEDYSERYCEYFDLQIGDSIILHGQGYRNDGTGKYPVKGIIDLKIQI